jgi:hypothetical protein
VSEGVEKQKLETVSNRLLEVCVENGLTITEMAKITFIFKRRVIEEIRRMEQRVSFTIEPD